MTRRFVRIWRTYLLPSGRRSDRCCCSISLLKTGTTIATATS